MIIVRVLKGDKNSVVWVGLDPTEPEDVPIQIFSRNDVIDPIEYYALDDTDHLHDRIYVRNEDVDKVLEKIREFYKYVAELYDWPLKVEVIKVSLNANEESILSFDKKEEATKIKVPIRYKRLPFLGENEAHDQELKNEEKIEPIKIVSEASNKLVKISINDLPEV